MFVIAYSTMCNGMLQLDIFCKLLNGFYPVHVGFLFLDTEKQNKCKNKHWTAEEVSTLEDGADIYDAITQAMDPSRIEVNHNMKVFTFKINVSCSVCICLLYVWLHNVHVSCKIYILIFCLQDALKFLPAGGTVIISPGET